MKLCQTTPRHHEAHGEFMNFHASVPNWGIKISLKFAIHYICMQAFLLVYCSRRDANSASQHPSQTADSPLRFFSELVKR